MVIFNGNVETARARDAHLRVLISNPDRAKANGTLAVPGGWLAGWLPSAFLPGPPYCHAGIRGGSTSRVRNASEEQRKRKGSETKRE